MARGSREPSGPLPLADQLTMGWLYLLGAFVTFPIAYVVIVRAPFSPKEFDQLDVLIAMVLALIWAGLWPMTLMAGLGWFIMRPVFRAMTWFTNKFIHNGKGT